MSSAAKDRFESKAVLSFMTANVGLVFLGQ